MDSYDIIQAAKGRSFNTYTEEDAKETVRIQIDRAFFLAGIPAPDALAYEQLVDEVLGKIQRSYGYMTSQELALVVEAGVGGELTRQTRPGAATIFGWIAAYMASETRRDAIRNYRSNTPVGSVKLSDAQVEELVKAAQERIPTEGELYLLRMSGALTPRVVDILNKAAEVRALNATWDEYKRTGGLGKEFGNGYYAMAMDAARRRGLFAIRQEHLETCKEMARKEYRRQNRIRSMADIFDYTPEFIAKRILLQMCYNGQANTGRDLVVSA